MSIFSVQPSEDSEYVIVQIVDPPLCVQTTMFVLISLELVIMAFIG